MPEETPVMAVITFRVTVRSERAEICKQILKNPERFPGVTVAGDASPSSDWNVMVLGKFTTGQLNGTILNISHSFGDKIETGSLRSKIFTSYYPS